MRLKHNRRKKIRKRYIAFKLSKSAVDQLRTMFDGVPPSELRDNLIEIYHTYLIYVNDTLPINFSNVASNMHSLMHTLQIVQEEFDGLRGQN